MSSCSVMGLKIRLHPYLPWSVFAGVNKQAYPWSGETNAAVPILPVSIPEHSAQEWSLCVCSLKGWSPVLSEEEWWPAGHGQETSTNLRKGKWNPYHLHRVLGHQLTQMPGSFCVKHCFFCQSIDMKTKSKKSWLMGKGPIVRSCATRIQT